MRSRRSSARCSTYHGSIPARMKPEFVSLRIDEILRQLEVEFTPLAHSKGLRLDFVHCSLAVQSDRRLLRRLLQNLVSNAIKYTPEGRVLVGCRRHNGPLRIDVYDTGLGIPVSKRQVDLPGVSPARPGRQGGARARSRPVDRGADCARAQSQGRGQLDGRSRLAFLDRCAAGFDGAAARAAAHRGRDRSRAAQRHRGGVHRQRRRNPQRHGDGPRPAGDAACSRRRTSPPRSRRSTRPASRRASC